MKLATIFTCILSISALNPLVAEKDPTCEAACPMEWFIAFFPEPFVKATLDKFNIPEEKRAAIAKELTHHELDINSIVESKAVKMDPNPLNHADQQEVVVRLYDDAVLQVFTKVMNDNGITDHDQITLMLDDIYKQKTERFKRCMMIDIESSK